MGLALDKDDVCLQLLPERGGGIGRFTWRGHDIFRPADNGSDPLKLSNFPLIPYCNRIAHGRFTANGQDVTLPMTHEAADGEHSLHGLGWITPWHISASDETSAALMQSHDGSIWPWAYDAEQHFELTDNGYIHRIAITNRAQSKMPYGLGLHPYFPRGGAHLSMPVAGRWNNGADRLPDGYESYDAQPDWFDGSFIDHCYARSGGGDIVITAPAWRLTMKTDGLNQFAHVYLPQGEDYFCVEPVSHIPDAVNSDLPEENSGQCWLMPGERAERQVEFIVQEPE
ncbi:aldose 1-epimerase [Sphingorhabdus arenilitoris]|uniref:Aldose 1-epimerase n=1 Tax=Sphingorhabdus arenilitoris TaxID=1490041 RepID=A0ABV8REY6_9SPHN